MGNKRSPEKQAIKEEFSRINESETHLVSNQSSHNIFAPPETQSKLGIGTISSDVDAETGPDMFAKMMVLDDEEE